MKRSIASRVREYFDTNRENVFQLKPYLLKDGKKHPVAIICPGGGYRRICGFIEGHPYAKKLNAMGYHAIVVYYRVNVLARYPAPQDDLARAVGVTRQTIISLENGKYDASLKLAHKIARYFETTIETIFVFEED